MANVTKAVNLADLCGWFSECCDALPLGQVSYDWSSDLGSRWVEYCSCCGEISDFECAEHAPCFGVNPYPILVKPEFMREGG